MESWLAFSCLKRFLINDKIFHGLECSGMLPVAYKIFCDSANIGFLGTSLRDQLQVSYATAIDSAYNESIKNALCDEISHVDNLSTDGINVLSDARHGWRKNAKDTSVVVIGEKS